MGIFATDFFAIADYSIGNRSLLSSGRQSHSCNSSKVGRYQVVFCAKLLFGPLEGPFCKTVAAAHRSF